MFITVLHITYNNMHLPHSYLFACQKPNDTGCHTVGGVSSFLSSAPLVNFLRFFDLQWLVDKITFNL
jgi:hypothetical protein